MPIPNVLLQRPENQILLTCARGPEKQEEFVQALGAVKDWDYLGRKIRDNRLILLFLHHLKGHETSVPIAFLTEMETLGEQLLHWNLAFLAELQTITRVLNDGGVRFLCYKGPLLAYEAYHTLALRHFSDLDLVVSPHDVEKALDHLQILGYRKLDKRLSASEFFRSHQQSTAYEIHVVSADGLMCLDLHWAISAPHEGFPRDFEQLWSKRTHNVPLGSIVTLGREDLIVVLCFHGLKHNWGGLEWIGSLLGVLKSEDANSLDWEYISAVFSGCGCERILYLGLHLASQLDSFGEQHEKESHLFPPNIANSMARDQSVRKMARIVWELKLRGAEKPTHSVMSTLKHFALPFYFGLWGRSRAGKRREFTRGSLMDVLSSLERSRLIFSALQPWRSLRGIFQR